MGNRMICEREFESVAAPFAPVSMKGLGARAARAGGCTGGSTVLFALLLILTLAAVPVPVLELDRGVGKCGNSSPLRPIRVRGTGEEDDCDGWMHRCTGVSVRS